MNRRANCSVPTTSTQPRGNRNPFNAILSGTRGAVPRAGSACSFLSSVAGLLAYVLCRRWPFARLSNPGVAARNQHDSGDGAAAKALRLHSVLGGEALRFLYLLLLGVLGSMIASRGIQFFMASESVIDEAVMGNMDEDV
jgi:hypothetical protein